MNRCTALRFLATAVLGIAAGNVSANGFRLASQDGFATARGEAFVATADNASAIYYNPAGITQLKGNQFRAGLYGIHLDTSYRPPSVAANSGYTYHNSAHLAAVPQLFYTYTPKDWHLTLGLGVYAPYGGKIDWPQDTGFRTVATQGRLTYLTINPAVAVKLSPSLSLGGGLEANYANLYMEQGLRSSYRFPNFYRFKGDGWSVGYNLGLLWQPLGKISLGAVFRSKAAVTVAGHTEFEQFSAQIPDTRVPARADFTFPLDAVVGISYRPTPKWNLEFDADYTDWNSFGTTTIYQLGAVQSGISQNPKVTLNWQPSWMFEFGVTRYFSRGWHVSAGYDYDENSVPETYYTPLAADMDRHFLSIGAGRRGRRFDFDIAYQFGYGPAHTVSGSRPSSTPGRANSQTADGTYNFVSHAVLVTVGMHF